MVSGYRREFLIEFTEFTEFTELRAGGSLHGGILFFAAWDSEAAKKIL